MGLTVLRQAMMISTVALRRRLLVSLEINNKDPSYEWFLAWMSRQQGSGGHFFRAWTRSHQLSVQTKYEQHKNGSSSVLFNLVAGPGNHLVRYNGVWLQVSAPFYTLITYSIYCIDQKRARNPLPTAYVWYSLGNSDLNHAVK